MNTAQRNLSGGEIAPALYARTDTARYATSLRTLRNFLCLKAGGVTNRAGTEYAANTKANGRVLLVDFVFADDSLPYVLEFGDRYMRLYQDGAPVQSGALPWDFFTAYPAGTVVTQGGAYYHTTPAVPGAGIAPPGGSWVLTTGPAYEMPTPYLIADLLATPFQWVQTADVATIVHPLYAPMELRRYGNTLWTLTAKAFGPGIVAPASIAVVGPAGPGLFWGVTAVDISGSESLVRVSAVQPVLPGATPAGVTWPIVAAAVRYNVYRGSTASSLALIGTATPGTTLTFNDFGTTLGTTSPATPYNPFASPGNYPSAVGMYQQRMAFAATNNQPETVWASRVGGYGNLELVFPSQDDSPVTFTIAGRRVNRVQHLLELGRLILLTTGGEFTVEGDAGGALTPTDINLRQQVYVGAARVRPAIVGNVILYVQARGSIIRDFAFELNQGFDATDLTLFASHLFAGLTVVDMAFQQTPHPTLWVVRSDGILLGLTYLREQDILGWHRHDTDGLVEDVCVVPEGDEDRLYLCVNRNGQRIVERMASRLFTDVRDAVFMDSALSYDGRNTTTETMTLSGSTSWDEQEELTITRGVGGFSAGEIGNAIDFTDATGAQLRVVLSGYSSTTVMQGFPARTVPVELRSTLTAVWTRAVDSVSGLGHLEGKALAVVGDGYVVASPNNAEVSVSCVVSGGSITLDQPYGVIHAGLPYISDLETLDIDSPSGPSLKASKMIVNEVTVWLEQSRGFFAGQSFPTGSDPLEHMSESKIRDVTDEYGPIALMTDTIDVKIDASWNSNGRVAIRNVDPIPLTVLAVIPRGHLTTG